VLLEHRRFAIVRRRLTPMAQLLAEYRATHPQAWRQIVIGAVALLAAAWAFGEIAEDVVAREALSVFDEKLARWLHARATPPLTRGMLVATELGDRVVVTGITLGAAFFFVWTRRWHWLLALILVVPGGALLNELMKLAFQRARPTFDNPILALTSYSFPSGHAMTATLLYSLLAVFAFQVVETWTWRVFVMLVSTGMVAVVGLSRMYLGAHYLSDVLAAIAAGVVWLVLCLSALETLRYRRARRRRGGG
jgi:membrane-associated phospholipid phosphatase